VTFAGVTKSSRAPRHPTLAVRAGGLALRYRTVAIALVEVVGAIGLPAEPPAAPLRSRSPLEDSGLSPATAAASSADGGLRGTADPSEEETHSRAAFRLSSIPATWRMSYRSVGEVDVEAHPLVAGGQ